MFWAFVQVQTGWAVGFGTCIPEECQYQDVGWVILIPHTMRCNLQQK